MAGLTKIASILAAPAYWRALAHGVAPTTEHGPALVGREFGTVIDVGANKGQFAVFARRRWPNARLLCFEPLPGPRARLTRLMDGAAEVLDCALGETEGEAIMHVAERQDSSSLLPIGRRQKAIFRTEEAATQPVPVRRLDAVLAGRALDAPVLLKIDVQGFERQVLAGAEGVLDRIDAIYVEASYVELYEGQALADDVLAFLAGHGFALDGRHNAAIGPDGKCVQADFLLTRAAA